MAIIVAPIFLQTTVLLAAYAAIALTPQLSIPSGFIVAGGDGANPEIAPLVAWHHLSTSWFSYAGLGFDGSSVRPVLFPFVVSALALGHIGFSAEFVCRFWYSALFLLQAAGVALLAAETFPGRLSRLQLLVIALFGAVNPYQLISLHGPYLTTQLSIAAMPALIAMGMRYIRRGVFADFAACVSLIVLASTGDANPAVFAIEGLALAAVTILWLRPRHFVRTLLLAAAYVAANAIWLGPSIIALHHDLPFLGPVSSQYSDATLRVVSQFSGWPHSVRLIGEYLFFNNVAGAPYLVEGTTYDTNPLLITLTCIVPICAAVGFIEGIRRRDQTVVKVAVLTALVLFFAKGNAPPLGDVFDYLSAHAIAFRGFRDSFGKFEWLVVIGYSLLLARFLISVETLKRSWISTMVVSFVVAATIASGYPMFLGHLFWTHAVVRIPQRYFDVANSINHDKTDYALVESPMAPAIFDAYRWGYIGAGLNAQLIERPLLSGAHRLLSPINESVSQEIEHSSRIGSNSLVPWLGLYGFGGILTDTASDPTLFAPALSSSDIPVNLPFAREDWNEDGFEVLKFDKRYVNARLYAAQYAISGVQTQGEIAATCRALDGCRDVAFIPVGYFKEAAKPTFVLRQKFYQTTRAMIPKPHAGTRIFIDDLDQTRDLAFESNIDTYSTIFPTHPAVIRIAPARGDVRHADAIVERSFALGKTRRICHTAGAASETELVANARSSGLGVLALTYTSDPQTNADLLIFSPAGASQGRLAKSLRPSSVVRMVPLSAGTRARIILEASSSPSCLEVHYFVFARVVAGSPYRQGNEVLRAAPTPYQRLYRDPLASYNATAGARFVKACMGRCAPSIHSRDKERPLTLHALTSGNALLGELDAKGSVACANVRHAIFRGEDIRLVPGLHYRVHLSIDANGPGHVRAAVLSETEFGIAEGGRDILGDGPQTFDIQFTAPNNVPDAVLYVWFDGTATETAACIGKAEMFETPLESGFPLTETRLHAVSWHAYGDVASGYDVRVAHLQATPTLVILNQTYDDRWELTGSPGVLASHVVANGGVNGWILSGSGTFDGTLRFRGGEQARLWFWVGGTSFCVVTLIAAALAQWTRRRLRPGRAGK